jgi:hypothetical protein
MTERSPAVVAWVGASAEAWGQSKNTTSTARFKKSTTRVDPSDKKLCENIGKS